MTALAVPTAAGASSFGWPEAAMLVAGLAFIFLVLWLATR